MPALCVQVDWYYPTSEPEDKTPEGAPPSGSLLWIVHFKGSDMQGLELAGAFNEGDPAVFVTSGSLVPRNPATELAVRVGRPDSYTPPPCPGLAPDRIVVREYEVDKHVRQGMLLPFHLVRRYFNLPLDDDHPPPVGTDLSRDMRVEEIDLRTEGEKRTQLRLDAIPKESRVTIYDSLEASPRRVTNVQLVVYRSGVITGMPEGDAWEPVRSFVSPAGHPPELVPTFVLNLAQDGTGGTAPPTDAPRDDLPLAAPRIVLKRVKTQGKWLSIYEMITATRGWPCERIDAMWDATLPPEMRSAKGLFRALRGKRPVGARVTLLCNETGRTMDLTIE